MTLKQTAKKLLGKKIYAVRKDGRVITGKLVSIRGNALYIRNTDGKKVTTKAVLPLVLFDLLAIGTYGAYGPGYGYYGYPGVYGPYGYPGYFV